MANNCWNWITITGNQKDLKSINKAFEKAEANTNEFSFYAFDFMTNEKGEKRDAGTRWFDFDIVVYEEHLFLSGDSAWSPALQFFVELSKVYPNVNIDYEYAEAGCDFGGKAEIKAGEISDDFLDYWGYHFKYDFEYIEMSYLDEAGCFDSYEEFKECGIYKVLTDEQKAEVKKEVFKMEIAK